MSIADMQDRAEALGRPGGIANCRRGGARRRAQRSADGQPRRSARSMPPRTKIYPKRAHGTFRTIKWIVMAVTLGDLLRACPGCAGTAGPTCPTRPCWSTFHRGASSSSSSRSGRRNSTTSPACWCWRRSALFLVTSVAGRVWCGYACPQTVWTDLMIAVERFFQGDRNARMRLDKAPVVVRDAVAEGRDASGLAADRGGDRRRLGLLFRRRADACRRARHWRRADASPIVFLGIFTATTYLLGGIAREQVCIYMCPWPRIQGAMLDAIRCSSPTRWRGEPRGAAQERAKPGRGAATASTARHASRSARPASTSATARSSSASTARSASTPATRSWTRSAGRAG